jgi:hypothetical protein
MEEEEAIVETVDDRYEPVVPQIQPPPAEVPLTSRIAYRSEKSTSLSI